MGGGGGVRMNTWTPEEDLMLFHVPFLFAYSEILILKQKKKTQQGPVHVRHDLPVTCSNLTWTFDGNNDDIPILCDFTRRVLFPPF